MAAMMLKMMGAATVRKKRIMKVSVTETALRNVLTRSG